MKHALALSILAALPLLGAAQTHGLAFSTIGRFAGNDILSQRLVQVALSPNGRIVGLVQGEDPVTKISVATVVFFSRSGGVTSRFSLRGNFGSGFFATALRIDAQSRIFVGGVNGNQFLQFAALSATGSVLYQTEHDLSSGAAKNTFLGMELDRQGRPVFHGLVDPTGQAALPMVGRLDANGGIERHYVVNSRVFDAPRFVLDGDRPTLAFRFPIPNEPDSTARVVNFDENLQMASTLEMGKDTDLRLYGLVSTGGRSAVLVGTQDVDVAALSSTEAVVVGTGSDYAFRRATSTTDSQGRGRMAQATKSGTSVQLRMAVFGASGLPSALGTLTAASGEYFAAGPIATDPVGETYAAVGAFNAQGDPTSYLLTKFDTMARVRWTYRFPVAQGRGFIESFALDARTGEIFAGGTDSPSGMPRLMVLKQAAVAIADGYAVTKNKPFASPRSVTSNDRFAYGLSATRVTSTANGTLTLNANGTFSYRPRTGFVGTDRFTYRIARPGTTASVGTVTLTVR